ncbi:putative Zinc finger, RING/FYVE/PHD-type, cellulose synthase, RING-type zinc finger [Helianthus debilis subsp. tardiflorus]
MGKPLKNSGNQVCHICGENVNSTEKEKVFMPVMYVHSQFAGCAMRMSARMTIVLPSMQN